jgi:mycofactocin system glycosyltransferase
MAGIPFGFKVKLDHRIRVEKNGSVLIGGSPTRVLFLSKTAEGIFDNRTLLVKDQQSAEIADRLLELGIANPIIAELPELLDAEVTCVVPVRDRPLSLDRLLTSIGAEVKVIVVDDSSHDSAAISEIAANHQAHYLLLPSNLGPAGARNSGLALVTTPYVLFIDSDMVLDPKIISSLLKHFIDPKVAVVAPRILGFVAEGKPNWISRYEDARSSLDLGKHESIVRPNSTVSWLPSACILARVSALGSGFSEEMRVAEDVDLIWRLAEQGWRIRYEPTMQAHHQHRMKLTEWLSRKVFYGTGADLLAKKHGALVAPAIFAPWSLGVVVAILAQRRWSLPVAGIIAFVAAMRISRKLGRSTQPMKLSLWLTANGVSAALGQLIELLLRHWWPLAAIGCIFSPRIRNAVMVASAVNIVTEYQRTEAILDFPRFALARRLDDLAYGAGLWFGAIRGRSLTALLPNIRWRN